MKKFFAAATLILGVVVSQLVVPSQAQAQDYFVGTTQSGYQIYLRTDSVTFNSALGIANCWVKAISPRGTVDELWCSFWRSPSGEGYRFEIQGAVALIAFSRLQGIVYINNHNGFPVI